MAVSKGRIGSVKCHGLCAGTKNIGRKRIDKEKTHAIMMISYKDVEQRSSASFLFKEE